MITLDNLTRRFGATTAVDALNATIPAGAITALLGPNGAGKTTTLNLLTVRSRRCCCSSATCPRFTPPRHSSR